MPGHDRDPGRHVGAADKTVIDEAIREMELKLSGDDPDFVRRIQRIIRRDSAHAVVVFSFLSIGAVLLVVGKAAQEWVLWFAGGFAFLSSFAADELFKRSMRRASR